MRISPVKIETYRETVQARPNYYGDTTHLIPKRGERLLRFDTLSTTNVLKTLDELPQAPKSILVNCSYTNSGTANSYETFKLDVKDKKHYKLNTKTSWYGMGYPSENLKDKTLSHSKSVSHYYDKNEANISEKDYINKCIEMVMTPFFDDKHRKVCSIEVII